MRRHERDVTAQTEAVYALERFPSPATRSALTGKPPSTLKRVYTFFNLFYVVLVFIVLAFDLLWFNKSALIVNLNDSAILEWYQICNSWFESGFGSRPDFSDSFGSYMNFF